MRNEREPAAAGRRGWALAIGVAVWLLLPGAAFASRVEVSEPVLPPAGEPPPYASSFVQVPIRIPLGFLAEALEREIPKELGTGEAFETYPDPEERREDVQIRYGIRRGPFSLAVEGSTLRVRAEVGYWAEVRDAGSGKVGCGSESEPMTGELECRVRLGWGDGWRLDARAGRVADFYSRVCKPKPPGVNLTKRVNRAIREQMVNTLPGVLEKALVGNEAARATVIATWRALQEPLDLGNYEMWLSFGPTGIVADPILGAGQELSTTVAIEVRPHMKVGDRPEAAPVPLPETKVRLFGEEIGVAFECGVPLESLGEQIRQHWSSKACGETAPLEVESARVFGGQGTVGVAISLKGAVEGTVYLTGTPVFDPDSHDLGVAGLDFTAETKRALRGPGTEPSPEDALARLRGCVEESLRSSMVPGIEAFATQLGHGLNRGLGGGISIAGGTDQRDVVGVFVTDKVLGVRLLALGHATLTVQAKAQGSGQD